MFKLDIVDAHEIVENTITTIWQEYTHVLESMPFIGELNNDQINELDNAMNELFLEVKHEALNNIDASCY